MSEKERHDLPQDNRVMTTSEYWDRLAHSFNADYMKTVEEKYAAEGDCS